MKIFLMISVVMMISFSSNAQRTVSDFFQMENQNVQASGLRNVIDTIMPVSFIPSGQGGLGCFTGIYSSDSGYVCGNNAYGDLEKAQFYALTALGYSGTGAIQSVLVKFAYKTQNAYPEDIVVKIYSVDTSGFAPLTLLGTSEFLNLSSISTSGGYTSFFFDTPVQVSDSFFVSVQLPRNGGDTLVILSTEDNCVGTTGWAWEQWYNGTWHSIFASWIRDVDLAVFPVMDLPFGNGIVPLAEASRLHIYPNPATSFVAVQLPDENAFPVSIRILTPDGKIARHFNSFENAPGNSLLIPLNGLMPSLYFLEIEENELKWRAPLCIIK
ncbi:MAG TPA: hypothetical protein VE978_04655 [Chitinophagales bacterium]|nr:hypothetical protein [Chitinophagales bacterium]